MAETGPACTDNGTVGGAGCMTGMVSEAALSETGNGSAPGSGASSAISFCVLFDGSHSAQRQQESCVGHAALLFEFLTEECRLETNNNNNRKLIGRDPGFVLLFSGGASPLFL